jgi:hypothetical protein
MDKPCDLVLIKYFFCIFYLQFVLFSSKRATKHFASTWSFDLIFQKESTQKIQNSVEIVVAITCN